jgi:hypothetical protein
MLRVGCTHSKDSALQQITPGLCWHKSWHRSTRHTLLAGDDTQDGLQWQTLLWHPFGFGHPAPKQQRKTLQQHSKEVAGPVGPQEAHQITPNQPQSKCKAIVMRACGDADCKPADGFQHSWRQARQVLAAADTQDN